MSPRGTTGRGGDRRGSEQKTSVVGSTIRDVSSRLQGRGLPRGGIRERDGLKVAEGALPDITLAGAADGMGTVRRILRVVAIVSGSLAALLVVLALTLTVLSHTDLFAITSIETFDSEHVSADVVSRLADVGEGQTLLNVDVSAIESKVKKNPWVASVSVSRVFPATLRIEVHERSLGSFVAMSSGGIAWLLGDDGVWIEPRRVESGANESTNDAALAEAERLGVILISDVPPTVSPVAGAPSTDASIAAVTAFREQLSTSFREQVASYSAASEDDISCILKSGVEVSLGSATNIQTKESVASRILEEYQGQVTYINVRIPSRPTYRRVNSTYVREGTGATGTSVEEGSAFVMPTSTTSGDAEEAVQGQTEVGQGQAEEDGSSDAYGDDEYSYDESSYDAYSYDTSSYDEHGYDEYSYEDDSSYDAYGEGY